MEFWLVFLKSTGTLIKDQRVRTTFVKTPATLKLFEIPKKKFKPMKTNCKNPRTSNLWTRPYKH